MPGPETATYVFIAQKNAVLPMFDVFYFVNIISIIVNSIFNTTSISGFVVVAGSYGCWLSGKGLNM